MNRTISVWIVAALIGANVSAQPVKPKFDVASVKPYQDEQTLSQTTGNGPWLRPGGTVKISGATLEELIRLTYELERYQVVNGPDWIRRDRFAVDARAGAEVPEGEAKRMLRSLVEDRFQLVTHEEQRNMKVYALVLARTDGRLGPYIKQFGDTCTTEMSNEARKQFPPRTADGGRMNSLRGRCANGFSGMTRALSDAVKDLPVTDSTGLRGKFTYDLSYALSGNVLSDVKNALEDQLGLTLAVTHRPIAVRVIDSVSQPSPN